MAAITCLVILAIMCFFFVTELLPLAVTAMAGAIAVGFVGYVCPLHDGDEPGTSGTLRGIVPDVRIPAEECEPLASGLAGNSELLRLFPDRFEPLSRRGGKGLPDGRQGAGTG